jgi:23S rRNA (cytosine1962-C5)-methyltransferase
LDQRDNRILAASLAKGRTVLDAFTYAGGFALRAAAAGAQSVVAIDQSQSALDIAALNAEANGFSNKITYHKAEVFDDLSARVSRGERYGLVIVDPPKFARAKNRVEEAMRGYRRLIALALRLTEPEGRVAICSCTGSVSREMLENLISQVAAEERRDARILHAAGAAPDHPIAMSCPESGYLKFFLLAVS